MSLTFMSTIETSLAVDDSMDFLDVLPVNTAVDRVMVARVDLNQVFSKSMLDFNTLDPVIGHKNVYAPSAYKDTVYNYWQAYKSYQLDQSVGWSAWADESGLSLQSVVQEQLEYLFSVGALGGLEEVGLSMNADKVKEWVNSDQAGTFGAEVFNAQQLAELLETCADANRFAVAHDSRIDPRNTEVTTSSEYHRLSLHEGDRMIVRVRVHQNDHNSALWLVCLEQYSAPLATNVSLDPYSGLAWDIVLVGDGHDDFFRGDLSTDETLTSLNVTYDEDDVTTELVLEYDSTETTLIIEESAS